MDSTERVRRQRAIRALLEEEAIASQEELRRALARRGHPVTQATLSRDLRELRVARVPQAGGGYRYAASAAAADAAGPAGEAELPRELRQVTAVEVTGIDANESVVLVRTLAGRASGVAAVLDRLRLADLLGTIAGDDTVLVLPRSVKRTAKLRRRLEEVFGLK